MYIVGFSGAINNGKSTAAQMLRALEPNSRHFESWQVIAEVAEKLNAHFDPSMVQQRDVSSINSWLYHLLDILPETIGIRPTFDQLEVMDHEIDKDPSLYNKLYVYIDRLKDKPDITTEEIDETNKECHRPLLQWLGAYLPHCLGDSIWFDEIMRRIGELDDRVNLVTIAGVRYPADAAAIRRHGAKIIEVKRPDYIMTDQSDPTEKSRSLIETDSIIINNGNLDDLEKAVHAMWQDLQASRLRFEYKSVN